MAVRQLLGMIRYEMLLQWRRPLLRYFLVLLAVGMVISSLPHVPDNPDAQTLTSAVVANVWGVLVFLLMFALPVLMAEAIPMDRQMGVRELLDALPVKSGVYLGGKLLGTWNAIVIGMVLLMVVGAVIAWLKTGGYILSGYVEMWIVGGCSLALINSGLSVLLNAGQSTRRRAIFATVGFLILLYLLRDATSSPFWNVANPLRLPLLNYYLNLYSEEPHNMIIAPLASYSLLTVHLTIAAGFIEVFLVWLGVLGWSGWQKQHT